MAACPDETEGAFLTEALADADAFPVVAGGLACNVALNGATHIVKTIVDDASTELRHRHAALVQEAALRAEHQSQARLHMLDLAAALEESSRQRREFHILLKREQHTTADLRKRNDKLDVMLDKANAHEDARKVGILDGHLKNHQATFFAAMLWSRQVAPRGVLLGEDGVEEEFVSEREMARRLADAQAPPLPDVSARLAPRTAEGTGLSVERGDQDGNDNETGKSFEAARPLAITVPSKGDDLTMRWFVRLWRHHVTCQCNARSEEKRKRDEKAREEAVQAKITVDQEQAVQAERSISEALSQRLEKARANLILQERKQQQIEEEHCDLKRRFALVAGEHEVEKQALESRIAEAQSLAAKKDSDLDDARQVIASQNDIIDNAEQRLENERQAMRANVREVVNQLQQAEIMAKHMRETALKAKREAACSVPPEKFAKLMAELEEMRERLVAMGNDCDREHAGNITLVQRLEQNTRRLELERQFLPLLHKVRGPVGPKHAVLTGRGRTLVTASASALPSNGDTVGTAPEKSRMNQSQSAGFLDRPASGSGLRPLDTRPASGAGKRPRGMPLDGGNRRQADVASAMPSLRG